MYLQLSPTSIDGLARHREQHSRQTRYSPPPIHPHKPNPPSRGPDPSPRPHPRRPPSHSIPKLPRIPRRHRIAIARAYRQTMHIDAVHRIARQHAREGDLPAAVVPVAPEPQGRVVAAEVLQVRRHDVVSVGSAFRWGQRAGADDLGGAWFGQYFRRWGGW